MSSDKKSSGEARRHGGGQCDGKQCDYLRDRRGDLERVRECVREYVLELVDLDLRLWCLLFGSLRVSCPRFFSALPSAA